MRRRGHARADTSACVQWLAGQLLLAGPPLPLLRDAVSRVSVQATGQPRSRILLLVRGSLRRTMLAAGAEHSGHLVHSPGKRLV